MESLKNHDGTTTLGSSLKNHDGSTTLGSMFDFVHGLSRYCNNPHLSDVTLKVGEKTYFGHKFFLASASDVFRTMLTDAQWPDSQTRTIELEETQECQEVFGDFLQCLYSGQVTVSTTTIMPIFSLADKYNIRQLRGLCEKYMTEQIGQGNIKGALEWLSFAETYNLNKLVSHCYNVVRSNLLRIIDTDAWLKLTVGQMCILMSGSQLVVRDEYTLYRALERWMMNDNHRFGIAQCLRKVIPHVRVAQISSEQILDIEKSEFGQIYQKQLKDFILDGYKFHALSSMSDMFSSEQYYPRLYLSGPHCQVLNVHPASTVMANAMLQAYRPKCCGTWYVQVQQNGKEESSSYATSASNDRGGSIISVVFRVQAPNTDAGKAFKLAIASFDFDDKFHCAVTHSGKVFKPEIPTANVHWSLTTNVITLHSHAYLDKKTDKVKIGVIIQVD